MEIGYEKCEVASLDMDDFVEGKSYRLVGGTWEAEVGMPREMPKVTNKAETYRSPLLWLIAP